MAGQALAMGLLVLATWMVGANVPPPEFTVNMSLPPRQRYKGAVQRILDEHGLEHSFLPVFKDWNESLWKKLPVETLAIAGAALTKHFPDSAEELKGIAEDLCDAGIFTTYEYLVLWVYRHEFMNSNLTESFNSPIGRECTGILAQARDGTIKHGRNSDMSPRAARNLTLQLEFIQHDSAKGAPEVLFRAVDWYWFTTGVRTGLRRGVASISGNGRGGAAHLDSQKPSLQWVLNKIRGGAVPDMLVFRMALLAHDDQSEAPFESVLQMVANIELATSSYYVVAGSKPGEGALVTRGLDLSEEQDTVGTFIIRMNSSDVIAGPPPPWAIVQSNFDLWKEDPEDDPRRSLATRLVRRYGQDLASSDLGMFGILSVTPIHNTETTFTAIMCAKSGKLQAFIRDALIPAQLGDYMDVWRSTCAKQVTEFGAQCTKLKLHNSDSCQGLFCQVQFLVVVGVASIILGCALLGAGISRPREKRVARPEDLSTSLQPRGQDSRGLQGRLEIDLS